MSNHNGVIPSAESIRKAMELAWKDHHHARDQTWKTVQIVAILAAGLITIDLEWRDFSTSLIAGIPVFIAAISGILVTWGHRKLERRKFIHIINCEEALGLHTDFLIPLYSDDRNVEKKDLLIRDGAVKVPEKFKIFDIINPKERNTALFILRMHIAILLFSIIIIIIRFTG